MLREVLQVMQPDIAVEQLTQILLTLNGAVVGQVVKHWLLVSMRGAVHERQADEEALVHVAHEVLQIRQVRVAESG